MRILTTMLVCFACVLLAREAAADEHEPTPDPVPNCCLPECTYWMCITDQYGTRMVKVHCSAGEMKCWVICDPCLQLCYEVDRIPELCKPCQTCCALPSCSVPSSPAVVVVADVQPATVIRTPTVAPVATRSVMQPQCQDGQCYQQPPANHRKWGGGHSPQYLQGSENVQIQQKVVQLGIANRVGVRADADDDGNGGPGGGPLRNIIEKIRNRPSPGPGR